MEEGSHEHDLGGGIPSGKLIEELLERRLLSLLGEGAFSDIVGEALGIHICPRLFLGEEVKRLKPPHQFAGRGEENTHSLEDGDVVGEERLEGEGEFVIQIVSRCDKIVIFFIGDFVEIISADASAGATRTRGGFHDLQGHDAISLLYILRPVHHQEVQSQEFGVFPAYFLRLRIVGAEGEVKEEGLDLELELLLEVEEGVEEGEGILPARYRNEYSLAPQEASGIGEGIPHSGEEEGGEMFPAEGLSCIGHIDETFAFTDGASEFRHGASRIILTKKLGKFKAKILDGEIYKDFPKFSNPLR